MKNDQKQNILVLFWGRKGGGAKYTFEIARELSERDDVNLFLSVSRQCDLFDDFTALNRPGYHPDTYESIPGFVKRWIFQRRHLLNRLQEFLLRNRINTILIGMDFFWGGVIYKAASKAGARSIYVVHEPEPHPGEPAIMSAVKRKTLGTLIAGADHLVALTDHVKNQLKERFGKSESDISVIPHGFFSYYDATQPKHLPESGPVQLLYFGTVTYYKGLDILLKAYRILENGGHNVALEIWGSGDITGYRELLKPLKQVRVENRWIDEDELEVVFRDHHICVLPYRQVSQSGIVGAACSAAMPIVATPVEGLKEQMESINVIYSNDFSAESMANSIELLINDESLYKTISAEMLIHAGSLRWSVIAEQFVNISRQLREQ